MSDIIAIINGPYAVGYTLCFGLMGALVVQAYIYFTRFPDDIRTIKILVVVVLLLEILMTIFVFYQFWISVATVGELSMLAIGVHAIFLAPTAGLVTTLTHGFYCWRISSIFKSRLIPIPIMMVSLLQLVGIIYLGVTSNLVPSGLSPAAAAGPVPTPTKLSPWLVIWLAGSVLCDLAITICMMLILRPSKSHFGTMKSNLVKLTRLTIETGSVTAAAALLELILGVVYRNSVYHIAVFYAVSKLYSNCLLATLNFRQVLRDQTDPSLTLIVWDDMASSSQSKQPASRSQIGHTLDRVEIGIGIDVAIDMNETSLARNNLSEGQTCQMQELSGKEMPVVQHSIATNVVSDVHFSQTAQIV